MICSILEIFIIMMTFCLRTDQKVKIKVPGEKEDDEASRGGEEHTEEETALEKIIIKQYQ